MAIHKIILMGFALFRNDRRTDGLTDVTKLLTTFRNCRAKISEESKLIQIQIPTCTQRSRRDLRCW